jgi:hypothetical protein
LAPGGSARDRSWSGRPGHGREQPDGELDRLPIVEALLHYERAPRREGGQMVGEGAKEPPVAASIRIPASLACRTDSGIAAASR